MWQAFVELIRGSIFSAAHLWSGSIGGGILTVSLVLRVALLPLSLRIARANREQQRRIALIAPEIERIRKLHAANPARQLEETQLLYKKQNIRMFERSSVLIMIAQAPFFAGLFGAIRTGLGQRIRFAWIADLSKSNFALLLIVTALSALGAAITPTAQPRNGQIVSMVVISAAATMFFLWSASSAIMLSWGSGAIVSLVQNAILARDSRRKPA